MRDSSKEQKMAFLGAALSALTMLPFSLILEASAQSQASSEAGSEAGRESPYLLRRHRGNWYYRQQKAQERAQKKLAKQAQSKQQNGQKTAHTPHLQIKHWGTKHHGSQLNKSQGQQLDPTNSIPSN